MLDVARARSASAPLPKWESANLDVLRAVAVLLVIVFHFLEFFRLTERGDFVHQLGRWGVLLFFVHTSLVLMLSLERQSAQRYRWPSLVFAIRRVFRIYPLSVLVVLTVCIFRLPVGDTVLGQFVASPFDFKTEMANLLLIQNLTRSPSVMATLWTLPYEMDMYLVLPLLFVVARRSRGVLPLLLIWGVTAAAARAWPGHPFDSLVSFAPCFIAGVIGYKLLKETRGNWPFWGWPLLLLATTLFFLKWWSNKSAWGCCLIVGALVCRFRELQPGRLQRGCQLIARYSYGLYLSHYICIWFAFQRLHGAPLIVRWSVFAVCATLIPILMYHGLEEPMIAFGSRLVRNFRGREMTESV
jgi:peptidoglycan/LPS O-acetylase OafA/YrhL